MKTRHPQRLLAVLVGTIAALAWSFLPAYCGTSAERLAPAAQIQDGEAVRLGVLAYLGAETAAREWGGLAAYLEEALPQHRVEMHHYSLDELWQAVSEGSVDFVLTNPGQYVELESAFGISRIVTLEQGPGAVFSAVGATVVAARHRAGLNELEDVRGQVVAATSLDGFGGYQVIWRELADLRIDPARDTEQLRVVGFPMQNVLEAIDGGNADVGILRACLLEGTPDWQQRYKVLSGRLEPALGCTVSSRLYPNWPLASLRNTSPVLAREVAIALLQMVPREHGIAWTVPADYQTVHDLFRELQIGPYEYLRITSLRGFMQKYWSIGLLAVLALSTWGAYTLRAKHLVRSRTAALQQALHERETFEIRMRANQEQADHLSRLSVLGELSSTLAHELSQPLAGVSNYARSLLRRLDNGRLTDEAVREAATGIVSQADTAASILKRIKGFVRKRPTLREPQSLAGLVDEAVGLFRGMQLNAPRIRINNELSGDSHVLADALQIQQILLNLFKNAQDAMHGMAVANQRIDISIETRDGWAWIHVRDSGAGMTDAQMQHLFEPFYTTKEAGLGLGLSICNSIAEAHGGQLQGKRAPDGRGMVFSLSLPTHEHCAEPFDLPDR